MWWPSEKLNEKGRQTTRQILHLPVERRRKGMEENGEIAWQIKTKIQLQKQIRQNNNAVLDRIGQKTDKIAQFVNSNMVVKTIESVCLVVQSMKTVQKSTLKR